MRFGKIIFAVFAFFVLFIFLTCAEIRAQNSKSPQPIRILNNYGSIPFEDGKTLIAEVEFRGLDSNDGQSDGAAENLLTEEEVLKNLRLTRTAIRAGEEFYGSKVSKAVKVIREWLASNGYDQAEVAAFGEKLSKQEMKLIFSVKRGALARVSEIRFEGNSNISDEDFVVNFKKCLGDGWKIFEDKKYQYITRKCSLSLMHSKGFFRARINQVRPRRVEDDYVVTVGVSEGARYRIGEIKIEGATVFSEKEILDMFGQTPGDIADGKLLQDFFYEKLKRIYADQGYSLYNAEFDPEMIDPQAEGLDGIVNIKGLIDEGPQFRLATIKFSGIEREKAGELRKLFSLRDGEVYNQSKLEEGIKKINETKEFYFVDQDRDVEVRTGEGSRDIELVIKLSKIQL